jgi:hypothetical protein
MLNMPVDQPLTLKPRQTIRSTVVQTGERSWRLEIPAGKGGQYRLAQIDDYSGQPRSRFRWQAPVSIALRARLSATELPGTWGFGLWNDPFSFTLGLGGMGQRFPALPRAAWFFYASPPNYLSFQDDLPAQGFLAATFSAPDLPVPLLAAGSLLLPLALLPPIGKLLRQGVHALVAQGASLTEVDVTRWHHYRLDWKQDAVSFCVDEQEIYVTQVVPSGKLGLVLWIDNQYAAWTPAGKLSYGFLTNPQPAWLELENLTIKD